MAILRRSGMGFSLIELLVVIVIVALVAGMALGFPRAERREALVKASADELAATLREARSRAMAQRAVYAVAFHIQNAPGSSGKVLNNRSGGHWYRLLGPRAGHQGQTGQLAYAPIFDRQINFAGLGGYLDYPKVQDNPLRPFLDAVDQSWSGETHRLPPGQVRFLALTDEDRGHYRAPGDVFPPTYPRPWFGTWDETTKRLHPWGGYDPDLPMVNGGGFAGHWSPKDLPRTRNGRTISHSGFYYEGYDGVVTGCVHPSDRRIFDDTNRDGLITFSGADADDLTATVLLWQAGEVRPLFDARWGDFLLVFRPDGSVNAEWMPVRRAYTTYIWGGVANDPTANLGAGADVDTTPPTGQHSFLQLGPGDRISRLVEPDLPGSLVQRSGFYWITLAPDVRDDRDTFTSVEEAIRSLTPAYRVGISPYGEVRVLRVRTTPDGSGSFDTTLSGADWNLRARTDQHYQGGLLTNADGSPRGSGPVVDRILPEMLRQRLWWWQ